MLIKRLFKNLNPCHALLGMTTQDEQSYFEKYACTNYSGEGEIVDLGCWLGSTTIPLAKGLYKNPNPKVQSRKIHAFDQFIWEEWMDDFVKGTELEGKYKPGKSFLEEFKKRIKPWSASVKIYAGDLCQIGWDGKEIEFLLIDAMKSWELLNTIISKFFPCLIINKSYILHQDFAHWYTSWIHLIQYRLRKYFKLVHIIPNSTSFIFKYVNEIPKEMLNMNYSASSFSEEEVEYAFEHSINLVSDKFTQARIASAKVMLFIHLGNKARAKYELDKYLTRGLPLVSDLKVVKERLT